MLAGGGQQFFPINGKPQDKTPSAPRLLGEVIAKAAATCQDAFPRLGLKEPLSSRFQAVLGRFGDEIGYTPINTGVSSY